MSNKPETRGRKVGTKLVAEEKRKRVIFSVPSNFYDLLVEARTQKIENQGYIINQLIKSATKTVELPNGTFKHTLVINGKEIVSITNTTGKQATASYKRGAKVIKPEKAIWGV
jgi:hypothetical protein